MPKVSKETAAKAEDFGVGKEWSQVLDDQHISFVTTTADSDLTPILQGLPNDQCQCPHWGYVFKGRMWWRYGDREEVCEAGDAFYAPAGHTSGADAGSEFLVISPEEQMAQLQAHMAKRAQEFQAAAH